MAKTAAVGCPAEEKGRRKKESQFSQVLGRLRSNKMAMFGLAISLLLIVLAIAAPLIMPYKYDQMDMAQMSLFDTVKDDDIIEEIKGLDMGNMTPIEAMNTLYNLQNKIKNRW